MSHEPICASGADQSREQTAIRNLVADGGLWLAMVLSLQAFRVLMLLLFRDEMSPETGFTQILRCIGTGFRFDVSMASYAILPTLALTLVGFFRPLGALHGRVRWTLAGVLTSVSLITFVVDVGYFQEYHDQFNHWIFGLLYDDNAAIAQTIWKSYPVVWLLVLTVVVTAVVILAGRALWGAVVSRVKLRGSWAEGRGRYFAPVVILIVLALGLRGSFGSRPIQMKDAAVTNDPFLNKLVMNPFAAFKYAVKYHRMLSESKGLEMLLPGGDVRAAAQACFPQAVATTNLDDYLKRISAGGPITPPPHIVLVVEESYDAWGLRPESAAFFATRRLAALGSEGIYTDAFLSAGDGTMPSLSTLISGLPEVGVHVNYQPAAKQPFPTATAPIFKRLGYRTRFFYSGYLSWQRLGDFCREQGFDEVHGGSEMSERLTGNEWGVDDEVLFNFVFKSLDEEPSFDVIMTTSYHPPFSVDLKSKGFPSPEIQREITRRGLSTQDTRILGHLWYADKALGDFIEKGAKRFPRAIFVVTGDHWSRRTFATRPSLFGRHAVPFVLYGPEALRDVPRPPHIAGSHLDIVPTLVELIAVKGFEYHSFGRNMLDSSQPQVGFGSKAVLTTDSIMELRAGGTVQDLQGNPVQEGAPIEEWRQRYRQLQGLSWWRVMKGNEL
jgi:phosphoglycerol transferase MdoB-like AlkP superfamily enzyme